MRDEDAPQTAGRMAEAILPLTVGLARCSCGLFVYDYATQIIHATLILIDE